MPALGTTRPMSRSRGGVVEVRDGAGRREVCGDGPHLDTEFRPQGCGDLVEEPLAPCDGDDVDFPGWRCPWRAPCRSQHWRR